MRKRCGIEGTIQRNKKEGTRPRHEPSTIHPEKSVFTQDKLVRERFIPLYGRFCLERSGRYLPQARTNLLSGIDGFPIPIWTVRFLSGFDVKVLENEPERERHYVGSFHCPVDRTGYLPTSRRNRRFSRQPNGIVRQRFPGRYP